MTLTITLFISLSTLPLAGHKLTWVQRIAAAIGVVKGVQFLHAGIVPGVFSNNLKITDVLLDENLHVKINSFNLPLLAEARGKVWIDINLFMFHSLHMLPFVSVPLS